MRTVKGGCWAVRAPPVARPGPRAAGGAACIGGWHSLVSVVGLCRRQERSSGGLRGDVVDEVVARERAGGAAESGPVVEMCRPRLVDDFLHRVTRSRPAQSAPAGRATPACRRRSIETSAPRVASNPCDGRPASNSQALGGGIARQRAAVERQRRRAPRVERRSPRSRAAVRATSARRPRAARPGSRCSWAIVQRSASRRHALRPASCADLHRYRPRSPSSASSRARPRASAAAISSRAASVSASGFSKRDGQSRPSAVPRSPCCGSGGIVVESSRRSDSRASADVESEERSGDAPALARVPFGRQPPRRARTTATTVPSS